MAQDGTKPCQCVSHASILAPDGNRFAGVPSFLSGVDAWVRGLGKLRDVARQHVLAAQLSDVLAARNLTRAKVLDLGCGQGTQALLLARAGHVVTGLDISTDLLDVFRTALRAEPDDVRDRVRLIIGPGEAAPELTGGRFDLILCHGVLPYLDDLAPMLAAMSEVAAPRATLSLLVRNGYAMAMRAGLQGNWADAVSAFDESRYVNRLGLDARAHTPESLDPLLAGLGWQRQCWYGVRVFTDHLDDEPAPEGERLTSMLAAEQEAGRRDPYRAVAALLHIVYFRP